MKRVAPVLTPLAFSDIFLVQFCGVTTKKTMYGTHFLAFKSILKFRSPKLRKVSY